jgi:hypothetical protein
MRHINIFLLVIIALLSTGLLISQHFDAPHQTAISLEDNTKSWKRGETIGSFGEVAPLEVIFGGEVEMWLDERTEVKLIDGRVGHLTVDVLQGRIVAHGPLIISTRDLKTIVTTPTSFVHYSWLNKIEVAPIGGQAYSQSTLPPYEKSDIVFDPTTSQAADFYQQVLTKIQTAGISAE